MNLFLFILWPFIAFLKSLGNLKSPNNGIVFVLFFALFGYSISFQLTTADSYRIGALFCNYQTSDLKSIISLYRDGAITDIYRFAIYTLVKPFSNNPKSLFAVFGAIFGIFCYMSLKILVKERIGKNNTYFFIFLRNGHSSSHPAHDFPAVETGRAPSLP